MHFEKVSPVARQSAYQDKIAERIACGDRVLPGERNQSRSLAGEQRVAPDEQRTGVLFHNRRENRVEVAFAARFEDLNLLPDARRGLTNFQDPRRNGLFSIDHRFLGSGRLDGGGILSFPTTNAVPGGGLCHWK